MVGGGVRVNIGAEDASSILQMCPCVTALWEGGGGGEEGGREEGRDGGMVGGREGVSEGVREGRRE